MNIILLLYYSSCWIRRNKIKMLSTYFTVKKEGNDEHIIRKSRFIGYVKRVETEEAALNFIKKLRKNIMMRHIIVLHILLVNMIKFKKRMMMESQVVLLVYLC